MLATLARLFIFKPPEKNSNAKINQFSNSHLLYIMLNVISY